MSQKRKTINVICHYSSDYGGNFIPSLLDLASHLTNYSIFFSFPIETKNKNWIAYIKKQYHVYFFRIDKNAHMKKDIKSINKNIKTDIVYAHFMSTLFCKMLYPFSQKMKMLFHIHSDFTGGNGHKSFLTKFKEFITYKLLRRDVSYIYVSKYLLEKQKTPNSFWVPNSFAEHRVPCKDFNKNDFLNKHKINDDDTIFLFFGWSPYIKGLDVVVKSFLALDDNVRKKTKLIIVYKRGNGMNICSEYLDKNNIAGWRESGIIFIPPAEDVFSLYQISNVFISASRSEGFSYSILESLINGDLVFMSDIEGTDWAQKYEGVYVFPSEDYMFLSSLMVKAIANNLDSVNINERHNKIIRDYDINKWTKSICKIIDSIK